MTKEEIAEINPNAILWDGLDEAIIGLAKRESLGPVTFYNSTGEIDIKLDEEFYFQFIEEELDIYDAWDRLTFEGIVVYDTGKVLDILSRDMEIDGEDVFEDMTEEQAKYLMALEYFDYNIASAYVGEYTPLHLITDKEVEL